MTDEITGAEDGSVEPDEDVVPVRVRPLLLLGSVVVLIVAATIGSLLAWQHRVQQRGNDRAAFAKAERTAGAVAHRMNELLSIVPAVASPLAAELESGDLAAADVPARLAELAEAHPVLHGIGVAYEPGVVGGGRALRAPYHRPRPPAGDPVFVDLGARYDYTTRDWYLDPMLDGAGWLEPYFGETSRKMLVVHGVPFRLPDSTAPEGSPSGVVFVNYSLDQIRESLESLGLGRLGHAYVFAKSGRYLIHPRTRLVNDGSTIFQTAWEHDDPELHAMAIRAVRGETGTIERVDEVTGLSSWVIHKPVRSTGWTVVSVIVRDELRRAPGQVRRRVLAILASALASLAAFSVLLLSWLAADRAFAPWFGALVVSVLLAGGIGAAWLVAEAFPEPTVHAAERLVDSNVLSTQVLEQVGQVQGASRAQPARIPTGVFVKSVEFASGNNVTVSGRIWQLLDDDVGQRLPTAFRPGSPGLLPAFELSEAVEITLGTAEIVRQGKSAVVLWPFAATLRQSFSYERYPFDRQEVWLRIRYPQPGLAAVLVPDLDSYVVTNPASRPGVEKDLVLPGWTLEASYFNFRNHEYDATFGADAARHSGGWPELQFNMEVRRQFIGPFVSKVVPLIVALAMVFGILLVASTSERRRGLFGFTALDSVLGCAALFFVLSFEHVALREAIPSARVMYFEYFYFTAYLALMCVSMNAILLATVRPPALIRFRHCLLPKLLFWPTCLCVMLLLTLRVCW